LFARVAGSSLLLGYTAALQLTREEEEDLYNYRLQLWKVNTQGREPEEGGAVGPGRAV
jgi:hypothetical protein